MACLFTLNETNGNLCLGSYQVVTSNGPQEGWLVYLDLPLKKGFWQLFSKNKAQANNQNHKEVTERILMQVHSILNNASFISQIRWHTEADFLKGNEDLWKSTPV
jgi:hypothetical protein